jgi:integrase
MMAQSDERWWVLAEGEGKGMMEDYFMGRAREAFERRRWAYEAIQTKADLEAYQSRLRAFFLERLGDFPERTPLNPKVVGRMEREDFFVEKVIFESQPGHFVTAALYFDGAG